MPVAPAALILCAGRSRRMGTPKAFLRLDGEALVTHVVRGAVEGGCAPVVVVAGYDDDRALAGPLQIGAALAALASRATIVLGDPDGFPIDSIRAGLQAVPADCAVVLWPVDHPFADAALVRALVAALAQRPDRIVVPTVNGKRGHPVVLGAEAVAHLNSAMADAGAHHVVRRDPARVIEVATQDGRLAESLNTPADAERLGLVLSRYVVTD